MKIKTELYGVFYKSGDKNSKKWKWIGPFGGEFYTKDESELNALLKECRSTTKRKSKLFRQIWKSIKK